MNISKAEAKLGVLNSLGADFDDQREAVERDLLRWAGVLEAYKAVKQKIETEVLGVYKQELQEEKITADEHKAAIRAVKRCLGLAEHLHDQAFAFKLTKEGEKQALIKNIGHIKGQYDRQLASLKAIKDEIENPATTDDQKQALLDGRPSLVSGGNNALIDLQQRKNEAKLDKIGDLKVRLEELTASGADQAEIDEVKRQLLTIQSTLPESPASQAPKPKRTTKKKTTKKKRKKTR